MLSKLAASYTESQAKISILEHRIQSLEETITIQKRRQPRTKTLFEELHDEDDNKALFFSPAKIDRLHQKITEREQAELDEADQKAQRKQKQAINKQRKEDEKEQRRVDREIARMDREQQQALKKAAKEAEKEQKEASRQLLQESQSKKKQPKKKVKKPTVPSINLDDSEPVATASAPGRTITRIGQQTRPPQRVFD